MVVLRVSLCDVCLQNCFNNFVEHDCNNAIASVNNYQHSIMSRALFLLPQRQSKCTWATIITQKFSIPTKHFQHFSGSGDV